MTDAPGDPDGGGGSEGSGGSLGEFLTRPQMIIALSALFLSVAGVLVSVYEANLLRRQQSASVWPNLEVTPSLNTGTVRILLSNTGVGPGRVEAAAVTYKDDVVSDWVTLVKRVAGDIEGLRGEKSLTTGRVVAAGTQDLLFFIDGENDPQTADLAGQVIQAITEGEIDVSVCYCSVFGQCWVARMGTFIDAALDTAAEVRPPEEVAACDSHPRSRI